LPAIRGDGMQLTAASSPCPRACRQRPRHLPGFPGRNPRAAGTTFGVSAFQINFGSSAIETAGDAAGRADRDEPGRAEDERKALREGGLIIADEGEFTPRNLAKAGYDNNPLDDGSLAKWQLVHFNISQLTLDAVKPFGPRQQGSAPLQEHVDAGTGAVDVRPRSPADRRLAQQPNSPRRRSSPRPTSRP
jgi:2-oxoglutarate ferredoxin oxidoreductase subunit alpha